MAVLIPCPRTSPGHRGGRLDQESEPFELVVIDDCSPDELTQGSWRPGRARRDRDPPGDQPRRGRCAQQRARNTTAPYIFALDSDDLATPGILGRMADLLDAHPEADLCLRRLPGVRRARPGARGPAAAGPVPAAYDEYPQTAMFRRTLLDSIGGSDEHRISEYSYEDWALWLTLVSRGATAVHAGPGVITHLQRVHGPRMLEAARLHHREIYSHMRRANDGCSRAGASCAPPRTCRPSASCSTRSSTAAGHASASSPRSRRRWSASAPGAGA